MKIKAVSGIMLTLLLMGLLTLEFNVQPVKASGTIYIRADGSVDPPGAPISSVDNITYTFTADIYDSIVVERDNIVVDGAGYTVEGPAAEWGIYLSQRENVTIRNAEIKVFTYGIYLDGSSLTSIYGNNITNNGDGIKLSSSSGNSIFGNNITNNGNGIYFMPYSNYNSISGNNITNNGDGIYFWASHYMDSSSDNSISGNNITANSIGIYLMKNPKNNMTGNNIENNGDGIYLWHSFSSTISGNNITANNGDGIYLRESSHTIYGNNITANSVGIYSYENYYSTICGNNITNNGKGIYLRYSWRNTISGNNITNNNYGVQLFSFSDDTTISGNNITNNNYTGLDISISDHNTVSGNIIANNKDGLYLDGSDNNNISGNNITNNSYGVYLHWSVNNTVSGNNIANNNGGVYLDATSDNTFYHNSFIDNTLQVNITAPGYANFWDDGYPSAGNYWSDYIDVDQYSGPYQNETGSDGIWDNPYIIDGNNQDNYSLVNPLPRDIAVINVAPSKTVVNQNCSVNINVTVANQGASIETFNVTLRAESEGLIGYWKFDEGQGTTAYDSGGNNNDGTISGATWTSGKIGNALQFDGTDDYIEVPHSVSLNLTNTGTIMAWIKIPSLGAVGRGNIVNKGGRWNRQGWMLTTEGYNRIRFYWQSALDKFVDSQTTLTYDEWHHVAAVMDGSMMRIYIDGVQDPNTLLNTESADTTNPIRVGRTDYYGNFPFNGTVDEVRVYNMALGEENIRALFNEKSGVVQTKNVTLGSGSSTIVTFTWNTTGFGKGTYLLQAYASPLPGETDTADNTYVDGTVKISNPDIAITNVTPCKTVVGEGYTLNINITIQNQGDNEETFNVTTYYNGTAITLPNGKNFTTIILASGNYTTVSCTWNTTGVPYGNYTISAYATPVSGEINTTDNIYVDSWVLVTIPGDVNGDGECNILDVKLVKLVDSGWIEEPNADIDDNGVVNILDLKLVKLAYSGIL